MMRTTLYLSLSLISQVSGASEQQAQSPSAPPDRCTTTFGMWCTLEDVSTKVVERRDDTDVIELSPGNPRPNQESIIVIAPRACSKGYSSEMSYKGLTLDKPYGNGVKDSLKVKIGFNCTLEILLPRWTGDFLDWPYRTGISLIRPCPNSDCMAPSIGDLRPSFEIKYRRALIRPRASE